MQLRSYDMSRGLAANAFHALTIEACALIPPGPPNPLKGCVDHLGDSVILMLQDTGIRTGHYGMVRYAVEIDSRWTTSLLAIPFSAD